MNEVTGSKASEANLTFFLWDIRRGRVPNISIGIIVFFGIIAWVYVIPSLVAINEGVFTRDQVRKKVQSMRAPQVLREMQESAFIESTKESLKSAMEKTADASIDAQLAQAYIAMSNYESNRTKVAVYGSAYGNFLNEVWTVMYLSSFMLIIVTRPSFKMSLRHMLPKILLCSLTFFVIFHGPNWFRNALPHASERRVFSYVNLDISKASFVLQELRGLGWIVLLSIALVSSIVLAKSIRREIDFVEPSLGNLHKLTSLSNQVCSRWMIAVLLVSAIYLPITFFHWYEVSVSGDRRYITHAVMEQILWVSSLCIVSLPAANVLRKWHDQRDALLERMMLSPNEDRPTERTVQFLLGCSPTNSLQMYLSLVIAVIGLMLPLLQLLR